MSMQTFNKMMYDTCLDIWNASYGAGADEQQATDAAKNCVERMNWDTKLQTLASDAARLIFGVHWLQHGCTSITSSHKFAGALAASATTEADFDGIRLPSKAFRVLVPDGLLSNREYNLEMSQINVLFLSRGALLSLEGLGKMTPASGRSLAIVPVFCEGPEGVSVKQLLTCTDDDFTWIVSPIKREGVSGNWVHPPGLEEQEVRKRMLVLAKRLVAGLLLTYTHTTNWSEKQRPTAHAMGGVKRHPGPPSHRHIIVGRTISIDVRPALATYLGGTSKHGPPTVQTLVRGHYKRQPFGSARMERRVIWIEPYWRGPEDAPILSRPIKVG